MANFRAFIRGGYRWLLAKPLFKPGPVRTIPGVSTLFYVRAAETTPATIVMAFTNGTLTLTCLNEGLNANGVIGSLSGFLKTGFGANLSAGVVDVTKFILKTWVGTYTGDNFFQSTTESWDQVSETSALPYAISTSKEITNLVDLLAAINGDALFNTSFTAALSGLTGSGTIVPGDLIALSTVTLASGGTETFSTAAFNAALLAIRDLNYRHLLTDLIGPNAQDATNLQYQYHIHNEATYTKFLWIGGGYDSTAWLPTASASSTADAAFFNDERIQVCHGANFVSTKFGLRAYDTMYKAAICLGRTAGLPVQTPSTFKPIDIQGETHELTAEERDFALDSGVFATFYDDMVSAWVILQGINTKQDNQYLVDNSGNSFSVQLENIKAQLNNEIIVGMRRELFGTEIGPNRNTLDANTIASWLRGYLGRKTATPTTDNLIIAVGTITVSYSSDSVSVQYEFEPNFEVNKMLVTGFIIDPQSA